MRDICAKSIEHDATRPIGSADALTDRAWLAQSVLNILDGKIDEQIKAKIRGQR